jgi:hypothetical protein
VSGKEATPPGADDPAAPDEAQVIDLPALLLITAMFVGALALMALMAPR